MGGTQFDGTAMILVDKNTPYRLLTEVLYSAGQAEFKNYHLVVIKRSSVVARLAQSASAQSASLALRTARSCYDAAHRDGGGEPVHDVQRSSVPLTSAAALCARFFVGAGARADEPKRRDEPGAARLPAASQFLGMTGWNLLALGLVVCALGLRLRPGDVPAAQEPAGPQVDARDLRADLRDLQDVPEHAGEVHRASCGCSSARSSSSTSACSSSTCGIAEGVAIILALQRRRHRSARVARRVVRHPRQHLRELAHRVRVARAASRSHATRSRSRPA